MILYVVRHGEAVWNTQNRICGRTDSPLTEKGRAQAAALAPKMPKIDRVLCSPLSRARETAEILTRGIGLTIQTEPRLIEQDFGSFEGMDRGTPAFLAAKQEPACRFPGGESSFQTAARVYGLLDELKAENSGETVLLVCHGAVMRIIETYFRDMPLSEFYRFSPANCTPVRYEL